MLAKTHPETETDDALMAQVAARSAAAFRTLADRHASVPHRIGWRMLGDTTEAEDIAQEALLRLWDHSDRWQAGGAGVAAWLKRVAMNLALDRLRRAKFRADDPVPERPDDAPGADDRMDTDRLATRTRAAIAGLSDRQRAAIVLTYYEDCSNRDAADQLGLTLKAFESLLLRARQSLRASLEADGLLSPFTGDGA